MTYGVYTLGALMVAVGLFFVSHGVPIVRMELGWTQIMGGSVAASAGCIVMVLGLVLHHLEAMRETVERLSLPAPALPLPVSARPLVVENAAAANELRPIHPLAPAPKRDWPFSETQEVRPEPALTAALHPAASNVDEAHDLAPPPDLEPEPVLVQNAPALVRAERDDAAQGPAVIPPDPVADPLAEPPAAAPRPNYLASFLARRPAGSSTPETSPESLPPSLDNGTKIPGGRPLVPSRRTSIDLSSGWDDDGSDREPPSPKTLAAVAVEPEPTPVVSPDPEPVEDPAPVPDDPAPHDEGDHADADLLQPVVVGRYNAGAASYIMYSNGMIEVETEQGTHQFASMQDLKTFIERRDARVS